MEKGNLRALAPIGVFLVLYLGLGILFEYVLKIEMGFYSIPIVVIFLVALLVACFQNRKLSFDDKLAIMGRGIGDKTIVTMILIFMAAGIFVGTVGRNSAESVAYLMLSFIPPEFAVAVLFVVSCAHFCCRVRSLRFRSAALRSVGHGRRDVRRQPVLHLGHDNRGVPRSRMRDEGQVPREL